MDQLLSTAVDMASGNKRRLPRPPLHEESTWCQGKRRIGSCAPAKRPAQATIVQSGHLQQQGSSPPRLVLESKQKISLRGYNLLKNCAALALA